MNTILQSEDDRSSLGSNKDKCPICLGKRENAAFSDSCYHEFCFDCLVQWSKVKAECPMCKKKFKKILYDVSSSNFNVYEVPNSSITARPRPVQRSLNERVIHMPRFLNPNRVLQSYHSENFRRLIYEVDAWVIINNPYLESINISSNNPTGVRNISPSFLRRNPGCVHRLYRWLMRELRALSPYLRLSYNQEPTLSLNLNYIVDSILISIRSHAIKSSNFRQLLLGYLERERFVHHFIHEFITFAQHPLESYDEYDLVAYYRMPFPIPPSTEQIRLTADDGMEIDVVNDNNNNYITNNINRTNFSDGPLVNCYTYYHFYSGSGVGVGSSSMESGLPQYISSRGGCFPPSRSTGDNAHYNNNFNPRHQSSIYNNNNNNNFMQPGAMCSITLASIPISSINTYTSRSSTLTSTEPFSRIPMGTTPSDTTDLARRFDENLNNSLIHAYIGGTNTTNHSNSHARPCQPCQNCLITNTNNNVNHLHNFDWIRHGDINNSINHLNPLQQIYSPCPHFYRGDGDTPLSSTLLSANDDVINQALVQEFSGIIPTLQLNNARSFPRKSHNVNPQILFTPMPSSQSNMVIESYSAIKPSTSRNEGKSKNGKRKQVQTHITDGKYSLLHNKSFAKPSFSQTKKVGTTGKATKIKIDPTKKTLKRKKRFSSSTSSNESNSPHSDACEIIEELPPISQRQHPIYTVSDNEHGSESDSDEKPLGLIKKAMEKSEITQHLLPEAKKPLHLNTSAENHINTGKPNNNITPNIRDKSKKDSGKRPNNKVKQKVTKNSRLHGNQSSAIQNSSSSTTSSCSSKSATNSSGSSLSICEVYRSPIFEMAALMAQLPRCDAEARTLEWVQSYNIWWSQLSLNDMASLREEMLFENEPTNLVVVESNLFYTDTTTSKKAKPSKGKKFDQNRQNNIFDDTFNPLLISDVVNTSEPI